jgi:outer membrane immunogenic protein
MAGVTALSGAAAAQSPFDEVNFYIGATAGYLSGESEIGGSNKRESDQDIGILSALAGVSTHIDGWLLGIEGDIGLPTDDFSNEQSISDQAEWSEMNYNAHIRARIGRRFGDVDVFIAGGLAVTELEQEFEDFGQTIKDKKTLTGYSLGVGADWAFSDHLTARVELLQDEYDSKSLIFSNYTGDWSDTVLRGGLLFQF